MVSIIKVKIENFENIDSCQLFLKNRVNPIHIAR